MIMRESCAIEWAACVGSRHLRGELFEIERVSSHRRNRHLQQAIYIQIGMFTSVSHRCVYIG